MRFSPALLDKVSADPLNPLRRHIRDTAGKKPGCLHDFRGHNPGTALLRTGRPRPYPEPDPAGAHIRRRTEVSVNPSHTDRAEKPGEERAVHLLKGCGRGVDAPPQPLHHIEQLIHDIMPLVKPSGRQELTLHLILEPAVRLLIPIRFLNIVPELHVGEEVTLRV